MRINLEQHWVDRLLGWPESGMGYQRVDVKTADARELKNAIVLNAELLEVPDDFRSVKVAELRLHQKGEGE